MERMESFAYRRSIRCAILALFVLACVSLGWSQFPRLPKLPKTLPGMGAEDEIAQGKKTKGTTGGPSRAASKLPAPELTGISPDSVPPGGTGELALTGSNFTEDMCMQIDCGKVGVHVKNFKLASSTRAVAQIQTPFKAQDGQCKLALVRRPGGCKPSETEESAQATPEVFQVPAGGPTFSVSSSANMPVSVPVAYLGEGELDMMSMGTKMAGAVGGGFGDQGEQTLLLLTADSVKCTQGSTTHFAGARSAVKAVQEMRMQGQSIGVFRIVFNNGRTYNLMGMPTGESGVEPKQLYQIVKAKLGK